MARFLSHRSILKTEARLKGRTAEDLPRGIQETHLDRELKAFQDRGGNAKEREVAAFKAKQDEKKKALFAEIEKKLKGSLDPKLSPAPEKP